MKEIASVDVANLINRWYVHIRKREISAAVELRDEILAILDHMEEDQDLLVYFNLLDYRFKVLMEDISSREPVLSNEEKAKTDDMLRFYFSCLKECLRAQKTIILTPFLYLEWLKSS